MPAREGSGGSGDGERAGAAGEREVILITGTSRGIGRHLAEHWARRGAAVEGCSRTPAEWADGVEGYAHHLMDVTDEAQVRATMATIWRRHGRLDVIVNNAGAASMNHVLLTPVETVRRLMEVNFLSTFLVSREGAKLMKRRRYGRIINLGSVALRLRVAGEAVYAASKTTVLAFTQILAHELADFGVTCNVVAPTPVDTDLIRGVPREKIEQIVARQAIKRLGTAEDVAHAVDFFADRRSGFVTGQVLYLGGA